MTQVPDAPWIREAEMYGVPPYDDEEPVCPICGKECERFYLDLNRDICGCDRCMDSVEALDWMQEQKEK